MAITKIQSNAFPTSIDLSNIDLTIGANEIVTANIADSNVTHAKLHTDMDLTSKTVALPAIAHTVNIADLTLGESGGNDNSYIDQIQDGSLDIFNSGRQADNGRIRIKQGGFAPETMNDHVMCK